MENEREHQHRTPSHLQKVIRLSHRPRAHHKTKVPEVNRLEVISKIEK